MDRTRLAQSLLGVGVYSRAPAVLFRAIVVFTGVKLIFGWAAWEAAFRYASQPSEIVASFVYAPMTVGRLYPTIFLVTTLLFLALSFWKGLRYSTALAFFWLSLNLFKVAGPFDNGSDPLTLMLSLGLTLTAFFQPKNSSSTTANSIFFSLAVRLCQLHLVFMYFVSGWDKLFSPEWRSGDAIVAIARLDTVINPALYETIPYGSGGAMVLAWLGILFELAFGALVWHHTTRPWILLAGIVFHSVIAWALSLPDLSLLIILSYTIFLTDEDFTRLHPWRHPAL